uniref:Uncharacterized protein n=1 Tax=Trichobilharzia regenti TaxID=157069 RepID=A0AA85J165_TRIRE|nr:unnamed protein product [Trichobilharzia regenti]
MFKGRFPLLLLFIISLLLDEGESRMSVKRLKNLRKNLFDLYVIFWGWIQKCYLNKDNWEDVFFGEFKAATSQATSLLSTEA